VRRKWREKVWVAGCFFPWLAEKEKGGENFGV